ncbi:Acetylornithine aminotransferase [Galdieria sulphuraria]|nr:Acetylornithine aminotransferase [Galdieria sulphuraria]
MYPTYIIFLRTEANEAAIKLARKYGKVRWNCKEPIIISANKSFHGRTCGSLSATAQPKYQSHFLPLLPGFLYVDYNDTSSFLELVDNIKSSDDRRIVGVMLEAVQGEGGVMPGDEKFFQTVRQVCSQIGALMILDEVQVGMGRTGRLWGYEHYRIEPDIFTTAKGLAGGVPIGAMLCQSHCDLFEPGDHAATFGGNPLSCVAALSVCHIIEEEQLIENAKERGMELQIGLQLKDGYTASQVIDRALEQNLLVLSAGPQVVRLAPPLVITQEQVITWHLWPISCQVVIIKYASLGCSPVTCNNNIEKDKRTLVTIGDGGIYFTFETFYNSKRFKKLLYDSFEKGKVNFVIGGSLGLPETLKRRGKLISLSSLTFTHQMTRLILVEQIYRATQIHKGTAYHK